MLIPPALLESTSNPAALPFVIQAIQEWGFGPQANVHLKEQAARFMKNTRPTMIHGDFLACDKFDVVDRLGEVHVPTLVLRGTEDKLIPMQNSETLASQIPGAALQTIDGAGHLMMLEQPHRVAALLNVFLSTVPYQPGM